MATTFNNEAGQRLVSKALEHADDPVVAPLLGALRLRLEQLVEPPSMPKRWSDRSAGRRAFEADLFGEAPKQSESHGFMQPPAMGRKMTDFSEDQQRGIQGSLDHPRVCFQSGPGSGKTTTCIGVAQAQRGRGLYLAYNKPVQIDAARRFPSSVDCYTGHALAKRGSDPSLFQGRRIGTPSAHQIAQFLGWSTKTSLQSAWYVRETLGAFANSADDYPVAKHVPRNLVRTLRRNFEKHGLDVRAADRAALARCVKIAQAAGDLWQALTGPRQSNLPLPHDVYLKLFALRAPQLAYDYILYDEAQDATPAMVALLRQQKSRLIAAGDRHQSIYQHRGAINALDEFGGVTYPMLESFRFGQSIAEPANAILKLKGETQLLQGRGGGESSVFDADTSLAQFLSQGRTAVITRTNMTAFEIALSHSGQMPVSVVGGVDEMASMAESAYALSRGLTEQVRHPMLRAFSDWHEFVDLTEATGDSDQKKLLELVLRYGASLPQVVSRLKTEIVDEPRANIIVTTAHRSKGREWDNVFVCDDFGNVFGPQGQLEADDEALNVLYVPLTRARHRLRINSTAQTILDRRPECPGMARGDDAPARQPIPHFS